MFFSSPCVCVCARVCVCASVGQAPSHALPTSLRPPPALLARACLELRRRRDVRVAHSAGHHFNSSVPSLFFFFVDSPLSQSTWCLLAAPLTFRESDAPALGPPPPTHARLHAKGYRIDRPQSASLRLPRLPSVPSSASPQLCARGAGLTPPPFPASPPCLPHTLQAAERSLVADSSADPTAPPPDLTDPRARRGHSWSQSELRKTTRVHARYSRQTPLARTAVSHASVTSQVRRPIDFSTD